MGKTGGMMKRRQRDRGPTRHEAECLGGRVKRCRGPFWGGLLPSNTSTNYQLITEYSATPKRRSSTDQLPL